MEQRAKRAGQSQASKIKIYDWNSELNNILGRHVESTISHDAINALYETKMNRYFYLAIS